MCVALLLAGTAAQGWHVCALAAAAPRAIQLHTGGASRGPCLICATSHLSPAALPVAISPLRPVVEAEAILRVEPQVRPRVFGLYVRPPPLS